MSAELHVFAGDLKRDHYPERIDLACPTCGRKLRPADFMHHATLVLYRTCRRGHAWQLVLTPGREREIEVRGVKGRMKFHTLTWSAR